MERRIEPVFDFTTDEPRTLIHQGEAKIRLSGKYFTGEGEVYLELLPRAGIYFTGNFKIEDPQDIPNGEPVFNSFLFEGLEVEGFLVNHPFSPDFKELNVKWCPKEQVVGVGNRTTQVKSVVFHLFNFVDYGGESRRQVVDGVAIKLLDLTCDKWNVELKSLSTTNENFKKLRESGGYRLTHVGAINKSDGALFSGKEAEGILTTLQYFLSFVKGGWCNPVCAVGFDESGYRVWETWSSPRELWHAPNSWFDPHHGHQISTLFPGFMRRLEKDDWRKALEEVIYWYLNANNSSRGIDAGIILTQTAIERLSYEYAVKDKGLLTVKGFKDLRASDKFRLLFSSLGIQLGIPQGSPGIKKIAAESGWVDAPHALTEIRNSLVHPERKKGGLFEFAVYDEAWNLGLWYLEMGLLAICDYTGTFGNRLNKKHVGQVEEVPWTSGQ